MSNEKIVNRDEYIAFSFNELKSDFEDVNNAFSFNEKVEGLNLVSGNIDQSLIEKLALLNSKFKFINFTDVTFIGCNFTDILFENCSFHRVTFNNCCFQNLTIFKSVMVETEISDCDGKYLSLSEDKLNLLKIKDSILTSTFFYNCKLKKNSYKKVNFKFLESEETSFNDIDFSSCNLECIKVPINALKGATLSITDALSLINGFGIKIK